MSAITITLAHERDTKRMSRYGETGTSKHLGESGALYLSTESLRGVFGMVPANLTVQVSETLPPRVPGKRRA